MNNREEHIKQLADFISSRFLGETLAFNTYSAAVPLSGGCSRRSKSAEPDFEETEDSDILCCAMPDSEESSRDIDKEKSLPPVDYPKPSSHEPEFNAPPVCASPAPVRSGEKSKKVVDKHPITSAISSFLSEKFEDSAVAKKLNYYMHAKDITTAMIYERCYVDRKLISKISNRSNYHPSKLTMLALCIGLRLNKNEAEEFLGLAGYSFTNTSKSDLIFEYMITNEIYDLRFINEMLEKYDQPLMGA